MIEVIETTKVHDEGDKCEKFDESEEGVESYVCYEVNEPDKCGKGDECDDHYERYDNDDYKNKYED